MNKEMGNKEMANITFAIMAFLFIPPTLPLKEIVVYHVYYANTLYVR